MKRLLAYLFIVLGLGLTFSVNSYSAVYCVDNKIDERIANFKPDYPNRENEFFYFSAQSGTCIGSYTQVTYDQYNYFKNLFSREKLKIAKVEPDRTQEVSKSKQHIDLIFCKYNEYLRILDRNKENCSYFSSATIQFSEISFNEWSKYNQNNNICYDDKKILSWDFLVTKKNCDIFKRVELKYDGTNFYYEGSEQKTQIAKAEPSIKKKIVKKSNNDWRKNLAVEGTATGKNEDILCLIKRIKNDTYSYFYVDETEIYKLNNSKYNWQKILGPTNVKYPLTTQEKKELKFCDFKIYKSKNYDSYFALKKLWENTGGFKGPNFISIKTLSKFVDKKFYAEIIKDSNTQIVKTEQSQDLKGNELNKYRYDSQNTRTIPFLKISLKESIKDYNLKIPEKNIRKSDTDNIITYYIFRNEFNSSKNIFDDEYLKFSSIDLNNTVPYQAIRINTDKNGKIYLISGYLYYKKFEENSFNKSELEKCEKYRRPFVNRNEIKLSSSDFTSAYIYSEGNKKNNYYYKDALRRAIKRDFKSSLAITCSYTIKPKKAEVIADIQVSTMTADKQLEAWKTNEGILISKFTGDDLINLTKTKDNKFSSYYDYLNYDYGFSSDNKTKVAKKEESKQEEFKPENKDIDNDAPVIQIAQNITVNETSYIIEGKVSDKSDKIFVEIDGQPIEVKKGKFKVNRYSPVDEQIKIVAIDQWGNKSKPKIVNIKIDIDETVVAENLEPLDPSNIRTKVSNEKIAIIIGIENYSEAPKANYANLDAQYFFDYARKAFGVKKQNINLLINENATVVKTDKALSLWLKSKVKKNRSDLIIFFAGHGLASTDGKELYLLPQDGNPDRLERTALSRTDLFREIIELNPKSVTMFLDTCYSGVSRDEQMLLASARPIRIVANDQEGIPDNFTIFTASKLDQISSGLKEAKHGIFSYYLMKGLEGYADFNEDKKITNGELLAYMDENVSQKAAEQGREQNPSLSGDPDKVLISYR